MDRPRLPAREPWIVALDTRLGNGGLVDKRVGEVGDLGDLGN